ncbi:interleukin-27 subunit beta [Salminus brasiliensis]|uniref:interleukin-27 subunit beta n=1 Tax=Salminus brasiliensis TaxID=930266 RepID=UPI003B8389C5
MFLQRSLCTFCVLTAFFSKAWSQETSTEPPEPSSSQDLYAAIGSSVELTCADGATEGLEWRRNGSVLVSGPVLHLHNTSLEEEGVYMCYGPKGDPVKALHLKLGYAPSPPKVQCWAPSFPLNVLCSWTQSPDPILPTHYISTYWHVDGGQVPFVRPCQRPREQDRRCVLEDDELYTLVPYLVNITAVNALGSATTTLSVLPEHIVKPDPPVNVKATALTGNKVQVQWSPPPTWPDPVNFTLKYNVRFHWGKANLASTMGPYESDSMVWSGLMAGRTYHIRVSAMDAMGYGQSSEWSDPVNITLPNS